MKLLAFILFLFGLLKITIMLNTTEKSLSITEVNNIFNEKQLLGIAKVIIIINGILEIFFSVFVLLNPVFK